MSDPEIGKNEYTKRLDGIRTQFGELMEIIQKLNECDPGPQEKLALLMAATNAILAGVDDVLALERFGAHFKQTGELNPDLLKEKK